MKKVKKKRTTFSKTIITVKISDIIFYFFSPLINIEKEKKKLL
jgi:hypothetical protein